jgi:hypothetical protein
MRVMCLPATAAPRGGNPEFSAFFEGAMGTEEEIPASVALTVEKPSSFC